MAGKEHRDVGALNIAGKRIQHDDLSDYQLEKVVGMLHNQGRRGSLE